ncbi:unnamed protein product [Eruca vesicaria subsp. sativa]|uniref:F-box domain-containing protein n=1 Tax=Eruca vesicaria subsp. sativa TaxID=29727 RepID=A0ABC8JJN2_ERUVS|nr:unnamed protein product [Eruca vesicaria subsp. sativa]
MERNISSDKGKQIIKEKEDEREKKMSNCFPNDLIMEIIKRVPLKSAVRMCSLSKSWHNMICTEYLSGQFLSHSVANPRILFTSFVIKNHKATKKTITYRWFHSVLQKGPPELWNQNQNQVPLPRLECNSCINISQMVLGLVCCFDRNGNSVICNPGCGGAYKDLPKVNVSMEEGTHFFLGFDEKGQQFKILCVIRGPSRMETQVLSLVDENSSWRRVDCETPHYSVYPGPCLVGKLYYGAYYLTDVNSFFVMSFDLNTEEFSVIEAPSEATGATLVKINNKLALIRDIPNQHSRPIWIFEAAGTWSKLPYEIPEFTDVALFGEYYKCIGTIGNDQFVFANRNLLLNPPHLIYYDAHQNRLEKISLPRGPPYSGDHEAFIDYIENPKRRSLQAIKDKIFPNGTPPV